MIDAHCHLTDKKFQDREIDELVGNLKLVISNGTSVEDSKNVIGIAEKHPQVWATVGTHPEEIINFQLPNLSELLDLTKHKKVVAIGEAALDFYAGISEDEKNLQLKLFEMQVKLAKESGLPLVVHNRNADKEILSRLKGFTGGVQLHCFVEGREFAKEAVTRGWYLSFGGVITFKKSDYLREIVKETPENRILTETDAPYLAPEPIRGSTNVPTNVRITAEMVAKVRGTSTEEVEAATEANARNLFSKIYD